MCTAQALCKHSHLPGQTQISKAPRLCTHGQQEKQEAPGAAGLLDDSRLVREDADADGVHQEALHDSLDATSFSVNIRPL